MNESTAGVDDILLESPKRIFIRKWVSNRMSGKVCFMTSVIYMLSVYLLLLEFPNIVLAMYCITFPILYLMRIYNYIKSKSFLFLFDNCYFINTALVIYLWTDLPKINMIFFSIFAAANGPVLWAVLPFRNTLAYHDLDKITSCFIHWAPPIITWSVRWFPQKTSIGWYRSFGLQDVNIIPIYKWQPTENWILLIVAPICFLILHDIIYAIIVHGIIKPQEIYSDSFTYQRSRTNFIGSNIRKVPERFQLIFFITLTSLLYIFGVCISFVCYHCFLLHSVILFLQTTIIIWNGGCYYLDYFAYLVNEAQKNENQLTFKTGKV